MFACVRSHDAGKTLPECPTIGVLSRCLAGVHHLHVGEDLHLTTWR